MELPLGLLAPGEGVHLGEGGVEVDILDPGLVLQHPQLVLPGQLGEVLGGHLLVELSTNLREIPQYLEKTPTRVFSLLKEPTRLLWLSQLRIYNDTMLQ